MYKKLSITVLGFIFAMALPHASLAETVMEKVARTGILTVGTRIDLIPYAYVNDKQELVGYSIDIVNLIKNQLSQEFNKPITIQVVQVGIDERIPKIVNRDVDIVCDDVTFTWERDHSVDFSTSYSISGVKLLVKQGSNLGSPESLIGKRIGVVSNTTSEKAIKLAQPQAILVPIKSIEEGFTALDQGSIDALAGDQVVLGGFKETKSNPKAYEIVPKDPYARYGIACMIPENNSSFLDLVNYSIVRLMQGYVVGDSKSVEIVNRWFGPKGIIDIDPVVIRNFFEVIITTKEQIPLKEPRLTTSTEQ